MFLHLFLNALLLRKLTRGFRTLWGPPCCEAERLPVGLLKCARWPGSGTATQGWAMAGGEAGCIPSIPKSRHPSLQGGPLLKPSCSQVTSSFSLWMDELWGVSSSWATTFYTLSLWCDVGSQEIALPFPIFPSLDQCIPVSNNTIFQLCPCGL